MYVCNLLGLVLDFWRKRKIMGCVAIFVIFIIPKRTPKTKWLITKVTITVLLQQVKSVHFKDTVARFSVLSKLWSFSIIYQLKSKQRIIIENYHNFDRTSVRPKFGIGYGIGRKYRYRSRIFFSETETFFFKFYSFFLMLGWI